MKKKWRIGSRHIVVATAALLAACGGGGSGGPATGTDGGGAAGGTAAGGTAGSTSGGGSGSNPAPPPSATAPTIITQPSDAVASVGGTATFTVSASGTDPLTYQWQKNGRSISNATSATYTTPAARLSDDGTLFDVVVSNAAGSATSHNAKLSVAATPGNTTAGVDVVMFKNDLSRTGQYLSETVLTPTNVNSSSFGLVRELMVDGKVDAQPLYLSRVNVGGTARNVVFTATEHGSVYAFDADSGARLWQVSLLASGEQPGDAHSCDQLTPEMGITSTPVIDRTAGAHGTLYVVAMSIDGSSKYHQRLHALDVTSGTELLNGPMDITATYPNNAGTATFDPGVYKERAALLLLNGTIYTTWASICDVVPYSGWIIGFDEATLRRATVLNVGPNSGMPLTGVPPEDNTAASTYGAGIWMSGTGPAADLAGNIYLITGNGRFETTLDAREFPNMGDFGNSFLRLSRSGATLQVADYFAPRDGVHQSALDQDLGSGGGVLLPDLKDSTGTVRHLMVGAGKDRKIYVVDRDDMGKYSGSQNDIWQELDGVLGDQIRSSPAYFNGVLYFGPTGSTLKAFSITNARLSAIPTSQTQTVFGYPGTSAVISANGSANAILWAHQTQTNLPAVLHAYDPTNLAHELYNSNQASGGRDQASDGNKFITPVVTGGRVFVGTTRSVAVYGLLH